MPEAHETKLRKILGREWSDLKDRWLGYPITIDPPGSPPAEHIGALAPLELRLTKIAKDNGDDVDEDIPGLRAGLLHESVYLLHKSAHVLGSAQVHIATGMCTWSISSAYHAAFFAMKSVLGMLGVSAIESNNKHFLIDVWGNSRKEKRRSREPKIILMNTRRLEQRHLWVIFQHTLDQTEGTGNLCADAFRRSLIDREYKEFARHRNEIHYRSNKWTLEDLHACAIQIGFGDRQERLEWARPDFSLILAFGLVSMAYRMLCDIAVSSEALRSEVDLLDLWFDQPHNELYLASIADVN